MPPSNSTVAENAPSKISFRLKGGLFPLTLLDLHHYTPDQLRQDLSAKVAEAPGFFQQTPVIIGFESFAGDFRDLPLLELQEILREHGMISVALKGANSSLEAQAQKAGLAIMPANTRATPVKEPLAEPLAEPEEEPKAKAEPEASISAPTPPPVGIASKIVSTPVRSGQQVYAPGGDLIVLAPVSAGAEILADGNIHVYAPLRGRALAGAQGNESAQVFCQSLEAELISIAGHFKLVEELKNEHWKQAVRISLQSQALCINALK